MKTMAYSVPGLFLLLVLWACSVMISHGAIDEELEYMVVAASSLRTWGGATVCSGHKVTPSVNHTWVPLHRPHGPCSSSSSSSDEGMGLLDDMLDWDQLRTNYIRQKLGKDEDYGIPEDVSVHATQVEHRLETNGVYGSADDDDTEDSRSDSIHPAANGRRRTGVSQTVVVDTSSDVSWVQCSPCPSPPCHPQKDHLYDPRKSPTSATVPCGSPACSQLGIYGNGCSGSKCEYRVNYGGGAATAGDYITDTLTLTPKAVVRNFRFGCSRSVRGYFSDQTAGILALGGGPQSLLSQTKRMFGDAFSYCVPQPSSSGFLSLGMPVGAPSRFARTRLIRSARAPTFYMVRLQAIVVAGQRLNVPPTVFAAGSVIDSSAIVTQLPPTAYVALRTAFRSAMRMYPLAPPVGVLDTCYDFIRFTSVKVPRVALVFDGGAVVGLDPSSVMINGCLAFAASPSDRSVGFIGNMQQQNYEVLYDVGGGSVGFRRGAC